jgi:hypothetical protein
MEHGAGKKTISLKFTFMQRFTDSGKKRKKASN